MPQKHLQLKTSYGLHVKFAARSFLHMIQQSQKIVLHYSLASTRLYSIFRFFLKSL